MASSICRPIILFFLVTAPDAAAQLADRASTDAGHRPVFTEEGEVRDVFARLRRNSPVWRAGYEQLTRPIQKLGTIEGACYLPETGAVYLVGRPAEGQGPFHVDDLMVALNAVLFERRDVGMTIDPDPKAPHGPEMIVRFFGGCENTAFGRVLFECDRMFKSLSHGRDSLTNEELKPKVENFHNILELGMAATDRGQPRWNRFWLTPDHKEGPTWREKPTRSNGFQPILYQTREGLAVSIRHCRLYVRTEVMAFEGGKLVSRSGSSDKAAEAFANHFCVHYNEFAEIYPVFARAQHLARLVVLAEWLEKSKIPLDTEMIRDYRQQVAVATPTVTPASTVSMSAMEKIEGGIAEHVVKVFGGVDLKPRTFFASDVDGVAADLRDLVSEHYDEHLSDLAWNVDSPEGPLIAVMLPTLDTHVEPAVPLAPVGHVLFEETDGPTAADGEPSGAEIPSFAVDGTSDHPPEDWISGESLSLDTIDRRRGLHAIAENPPAPKIVTRQEAQPDALDPAPPDSPSPLPLGLPVYVAPDGRRTLNLPRLVRRYSESRQRMVGIEGLSDASVHAGEQAYVISCLGDIYVSLGEPQVDQSKAAVYRPTNPPDAHGITGHYLVSSTLHFAGGDQIAFDSRGNPRQITLQGGPTITFFYDEQEVSPLRGPSPVACEVTRQDGRAAAKRYRLSWHVPPAPPPTPPPPVPPAPSQSAPPVAVVGPRLAEQPGDRSAVPPPSEEPPTGNAFQTALYLAFGFAGISILVSIVLIWRQRRSTPRIDRHEYRPRESGGAGPSEPAQLFISYTEENARAATTLVVALEGRGYSTWSYHRNMVPGSSHLEQTGCALEACQALIVFVSHDAFQSENVKTELTSAHERGKGLVPILLGTTYEDVARHVVWRQAIGTRVAVTVPADGVRAVIGDVIAGLEHLGVSPRDVS